METLEIPIFYRLAGPHVQKGATNARRSSNLSLSSLCSFFSSSARPDLHAFTTTLFTQLSFTMLFRAAIATLAAVAGVSAHGWIDRVTIGGRSYTGSYPFSNDNAPSPIRKTSTTYPVPSANDPNMNCGIGAKAASQVAAANSGDRVTISWKYEPGKNWVHTMGPIMTYLAQVPAGQTADKFNARNAKFFKIAQTGQKAGRGSEWVQLDIRNGQTYSVTLPNGLPAGDYIMRHELIALHYANKTDGAQFFPNCVQLRVGGGSNAPKAISAQTVSFPGGYTANDKSLLIPNIRTGNFVYTFPGPPLVTSLGGGSNKRTMSAGNTTTEDETNKSKSENVKRSARFVYH
ncbi:Endoglucanase-4 [Rhizoctonia solani]|uniref:lytic cellulose monooxygenase (C4-dehydrogenating) n=1 Tax=Rhizoctonia solani TaxID=456999 RepID=A0A0K6G067_9AGAM|nr:Endoglucanase-4 [Rhizoctonia solani]